MVEKKNVPEIRFEGFVNEWESKEMQELFEIGNGKDYKHLNTGEYPVYGSGGYMVSVNEYLHDGESVCIGRKGTIDNPLFLTGKFWTVDTLFFTHSFKECLPYFTYCAFKKIKWRNYNEAGGVPSLSKANIQKIKTWIPSTTEQQKIGNFFRHLDGLIAHQELKFKKVTQLKAAMLDKMFPKEGSKIPEIRFKGFEGEWEEKKVIEVCAISTGKSNTQDKNDKGDYPFYVRSPIIERSTKFLYNEEAVLTVGDGVGTGKVFHYVKGKYDLHQRVYRMFNFQDILGMD